MRVLVFGASIAQGFWDTEGGWVSRLRKYYDELQMQDLDKDGVSVFNLAIDGNDSNDLLARIENEVRTRIWTTTLPVVLVEIGTNDSSIDHGSVRVPIDIYRQNLLSIIEKLKPITSKLVFIGLPSCDEARTTPVSWGDYHYTNDRIKTYEDEMKAVAEEQHIAFIPLFNVFLAAATKQPNLLRDGLHPSDAGHQLIFNQVRDGLSDIFEQDRRRIN